MDFNTIIQSISTVGFPIAMCLYLVHYMQSEQKSMRDVIAELREAIVRLTERIGKESGND